MLISGNQRKSQLACCVEAAAVFLLSRMEATKITEQLQEGIEQHWQLVCDEAQLSPVDRRLFWGRQFMNPYIYEV
ncbi:hypothetical protein [Endozoicomonas euniceicola]|uniref:Uncharacterized protein n=1 Tax=Endozoicomonas euniceicola TaxID=1234143 RepID=A0ABY6GZD8_9GAMM|nr:hypothetical protein [Endozoicomonas euniceicola]UYM18164.1 hypothetical protein NX720_09725 [Endozoicomonas euniceicola]